jgi:hypothetical protein
MLLDSIGMLLAELPGMLSRLGSVLPMSKGMLFYLDSMLPMSEGMLSPAGILLAGMLHKLFSVLLASPSMLPLFRVCYQPQCLLC